MNVVAISKSGQDHAHLRPPSMVMRLERLGAFHASRLSVMRALLRRMHREEWRIRTVRRDLDEGGCGVAVYAVETPASDLCLVCFPGASAGFQAGSEPDFETDLVTSFVLFEGIPGDEDLERLRRNAPLLEKGRFAPGDLILGRAEPCAGVFGAAVTDLAAGRQPAAETLDRSGCLMRTTVFFGDGKFGLADDLRTLRVPGITAPFMAEMLAQYLIREFSFDLADHLAAARGGKLAARIGADTKRRTGVGFVADLADVAFLVDRPLLLNHWISEREKALSRVRHIRAVKPEHADEFSKLLSQVHGICRGWRSEDPVQTRKIRDLTRDLEDLIGFLSVNAGQWWRGDMPWSDLLDRVERDYSLETLELVNSLVLEPYPSLVDSLMDRASGTEDADIDPEMPLSVLLDLIERHYGWALSLDFSDPRASALYWYVRRGTERVGVRPRPANAPQGQELRIGMAREAVRLRTAILSEKGNRRTISVARFLRGHPACRAAVRRVQTIAQAPYGEVRDNLLHEETSPEALLRCKLSILGAAYFDPLPDRRMGSVMYRGAPVADGVHLEDPDAWPYARVSAL